MAMTAWPCSGPALAGLDRVPDGAEHEMGPELPGCTVPLTKPASSGEASRPDVGRVREPLVRSWHPPAMYEVVPYHLESRLRDSLSRVQKLACDRGQHIVFDQELFSLQLTVQEALDSRSRGLVEHALEEVRLFREQLMAAPLKRAGAAASPKIGP